MGWGDMVVNLPVAEVFQQHLDSGADITILCTQELKGAPRNTVYITQGPDGLVSDLSINPAHAANALESLETYIISKKLLLDMVDYCAAHALTLCSDSYEFCLHDYITARDKNEYITKILFYIQENPPAP